MIRLFRGGFAAFALLSLVLTDTAFAQGTTTINALPNATTPLSGSETFPVWQLGATKKIDAAHLLPNSGVTAGTFGDATHCPYLTIAADGRVTSATNSTTCPGGGGGGGTPGGSSTQLQYNNAGAFGGIASAVFNGTVLTLTSPVLVTPNLGTPSAITLTNGTGLPLAGITGLGSGIGTFLATPSSANLAAAVIGETGSGALVFGTSPTISSPAFAGTATGVSGAIFDALGSTQGQILYRNATTWVPLAPGTNGQVLTTGGAGANPSWQTVSGGSGCTTTGSSILQGNGSGGCSNVALGSGLSLSSGTLSLATTLRANTSTSDTILASDGGKVYTTSNASAQAITLPTVGTSGFGSGFGFNISAIGAGAATVTTASNIDGLGNITLTTGQGASIYSDSTTYHAVLGLPQLANNRFFGNNSGSTGYGNAMTGTQATALLDTATTTVKGLVPAPGTATGKVLKDDLTWGTPAGASLSAAQTWTAAQRNNVATVTPSSNIYTPNFDGSNNFTLTLAATNTIANPSTTPVAGQSGIFEIIQDATGSRTVTWGSQYVAAGGVATLTLSTAANAKDYLSYYVVDSTHILVSVGALNAVH